MISSCLQHHKARLHSVSMPSHIIIHVPVVKSFLTSASLQLFSSIMWPDLQDKGRRNLIVLDGCNTDILKVKYDCQPLTST
ncbi:hypothetical protein DCAR_0207335 [Daucus carota subsp. sativus]|uniref:Uncharacterized protein n=1 Tax=Daucus carota subsp. sativus TaxID=79200 RepID=A0A166DTW1_DAUCS|nr:hypothetical protein DCAR_0207335 [Daucus carota subsp. sativus]